MNPSNTRNTYSSQSSLQQRRTRVDGAKQSFLPKPKFSRQGSSDRLSDTHGHKSTNPRSSSAEPHRNTVAMPRLSREASATKIPLNKRSRSQQPDSRGMFTPVSHKSSQAATNTPSRTPDRSTKNWQDSLDRALGGVILKDKRNLTSPDWLRSEYLRAQSILSQRSGSGGTLALTKPLTITRFLEVTGSLLQVLLSEEELNNTTYLNKLPIVGRRLLYPANITKSWLKTVNTLHTFPTALALIVYLMDMVIFIERPIPEERLYISQDEISVLRREYLKNCWIYYQESQDFTQLDAEYLSNLRQILGIDEKKVEQLQQQIEDYNVMLNEPEEVAAREEERRRIEHVQKLSSCLRTRKAELSAALDCIQKERDRLTQQQLEDKNNTNEIERLSSELEQVKREVDEQSMSCAERAQLLDEIDYATRVVDSKHERILNSKKLVSNVDVELATWQKRTLDSCVAYNQSLMHLAAAHPQTSQLAIDESDLMRSDIPEMAKNVVENLKATLKSLAQELKQAKNSKEADQRRLSQQNHQLEQLQSQLAEAREQLEKERAASRQEREVLKEETEKQAVSQRQLSEALEKLKELSAQEEDANKDLNFWKNQDALWETELKEMTEYLDNFEAETEKGFEEAKLKRHQLLKSYLNQWKTI